MILERWSMLFDLEAAERLLQGNRNEDNDFTSKPQENLFIAISGFKPSIADIRKVHGLSLNWERYSDTPDVLRDPKRFLWGVAAVEVGQFPYQWDDIGSKYRRDAKPKHRPTLTNFSHCEIWTYRNGQVSPNWPKSGSTAKTRFKQWLKNRLQTVIEPV